MSIYCIVNGPQQRKSIVTNRPIKPGDKIIVDDIRYIQVEDDLVAKDMGLVMIDGTHVARSDCGKLMVFAHSEYPATYLDFEAHVIGPVEMKTTH